MTNNFQWSLQDIIINPDANNEGRLSLSREEILILGWLIFTPKNRSLGNMARDCNLSPERCEAVLQKLIEQGFLRLR